MNSELIKQLDNKSIGGTLAAAAMANSATSGLGEEPSLLRAYGDQAHRLLAEIRKSLKLSADDHSPEARAKIDVALSKAFKRAFIQEIDTDQALVRLGQMGRLPPALYQVRADHGFRDVFYPLGISHQNIERAVKHPDDHQHLMSEGPPQSERGCISLFMQQISSRQQRKSHWLLVQTHRLGTVQQVTSAWRVYPDEVDLTQAAEPLDALKGFVATYGAPIRVGGKQALFVDAISFPFDTEVTVDWIGTKDFFVSFSNITDPVNNVWKLGIAYCIDMGRYRPALKRHGVRIIQVSPTSQP